MTNQNEKSTVRIDARYVAEIERLVGRSVRFSSVEDYIEFVLQELLFEKTDTSGDPEVTQRLRDLGYR